LLTGGEESAGSELGSFFGAAWAGGEGTASNNAAVMVAAIIRAITRTRVMRRIANPASAIVVVSCLWASMRAGASPRQEVGTYVTGF
jgi:hypothetical protein